MSNLKRPWTKYPYFETDTSAEVVLARMGPAMDPRLREMLTSAVKHLHEFAKESPIVTCAMTTRRPVPTSTNARV